MFFRLAAWGGIVVLVADLGSDFGSCFSDIGPWAGLGLWLGLRFTFKGCLYAEVGIALAFSTSVAAVRAGELRYLGGVGG